MEKEQKTASKRMRTERLMHMSESIVGSVVTKAADETESRSGPRSEGNGVEEKSLGIKDGSISAAEKATNAWATGSYLSESHKNNKAARKRIRSAKREAKTEYKNSELMQKKRSGETLTDAEQTQLKNDKKQLRRDYKAVKKRESHLAHEKNKDASETINTKRRHRLEHISDAEQLTNYGKGDGQGTGVEENLQDNIKGTATWAARRTYGAAKDLRKGVNDLNEARTSKLEHGRASKKALKHTPMEQSKEVQASKHAKRESKRTLNGIEEKSLTKTERRKLQKKHIKKKRNRIRFKNDKLSGTAAKIKEMVGSKGAKAAILGIVGPILIIVGIILIILLVLAAIGGMSGEMHEYTSYQAEDETLLLSNKVVVDEEKKDRKDIQDTETNHPTASDGLAFDEYQYSLNGTLMSKDALIARLKHDGNLIASFLTAKYFDYTLTPAIKQELKDIYEEAFTLNQYETIENRTSTYTDPTTGVTFYWNGGAWQVTACTYRYAIFHTDLYMTPLDDVLRAHLDTEEQIRFYELYKSVSGQKDYLFGGMEARDDIYRYQYDPEEYEAIYGHADISFSDAEAQQIYNVASTQLGRPYHWGGSSLSTGFDCSGYVYWVMNTSGVATFPRTSANVMLKTFCDPVTPGEAKPGDLIFFQGTYATVGASHVGIYLGNNQMIHCGDPIKITNISTNYWTTHFYTYGRIKDEYR